MGLAANMGQPNPTRTPDAGQTQLIFFLNPVFGTEFQMDVRLYF